MSLLLTEEQVSLRESLEAFLAKYCTPEVVRGAVSGDPAPGQQLWTRCVQELDLAGTCLPEPYGGAGADTSTRSVILEELGARLAPTPYLSSAVLAADTLLACTPQTVRDSVLREIARGGVACVAFAEGVSPLWPRAELTTSVHTDDGKAFLTGEKSFVLGAEDADWIVVSADVAGELGLFLVNASAPGVTKRRTQGADLTRALTTVVFSNVVADHLLCADPAAALTSAWDRACVAVGAEMLGGIRRSVEMTVEYAKLRHQFGRPIGSFQAVKHRCADMYTKLELARAAIRVASLPSGTSVDAQVAVANVGQFYREVARDAIHVHGGIGFTWEHDAHLYLRRAMSSSLLLGDQDDHHDRVAELLSW